MEEDIQMRAMARHFLAFISEGLRVRILVSKGTFRAVYLPKTLPQITLINTDLRGSKEF
jgi:hypothetical protein